jgi:glycosyltransferase involved in cell wall biosynthesis
VKGESIIYFAKEWGEDPTSCDHLFKHLAADNKVLWVNSISMRNPNLASARDLRKIVRKLRQCLGGARQVGPQAWVYQPMVIPLPYSTLARTINRALLRWSLRRQSRALGMRRPQLWTFLPNAVYMVGHLDESLVVYYCIDEWSAFSYLDAAKMAAMERELLQKADLCFATAHALVESKRQHNPNTFLSSHGVDSRHFATALAPETYVPEDVARLPHPVIGFFGLLHDWIDLELVAKVARAHPEWSIVLIGKACVPLDDVQDIPNVHLLGRRPYDTLPAYCKGFDVGIIPFVVSDLSRAVNPIKLREYLSAGLPVVSTDLPEVASYGDRCSVAKTHDDFIARLEDAVRDDTPADRRERSEAMRDETWEAKTRQVCERVLQAKAARAR